MKTPPAFIRFGGDETAPVSLDAADIVVLPLCYEEAPSYRPGSGDGPFHILDASQQLERIDEETFMDWGALKIHTLPPLIPAAGDPEAALGQMARTALQALKNQKFLLALGGDHAVTFATVAACKTIYPEMGLLQVDAHLDLRQEWNGSPYNHACVMRRIHADLHVPLQAVGIRSFSQEELEYIRQTGLKPVFAHEIEPFTNEWILRVVDALPHEVYISIDLDGLDPGILPATGTPEPGGLTYRQLVALLQAVGRARRVVGADINELAKIEGCNVSEFTAAKIASKILVYCTARA